jgi:hypothetical protein
MKSSGRALGEVLTVYRSAARLRPVNESLLELDLVA